MKTRIRQLTEQEKRSLGEQQMIADWLQIFPKGILSIVADTFDLWKLITEYLPANKEAIMARGEYKVIIPNLTLRKDEILVPYIENNGKIYYKTTFIGEDNNTKNNYHISQEEINRQINNGFIQYIPGKLVIRPDSGDPVDIICGDAQYQSKADYESDKNLYPTPINKGVIELLWDIFGGSINEQGYKVLDSHIGAIYGDSITIDRAIQICERLKAKGFASTNIVLGIASYTYQYNTRDTFGFAMKATYGEITNKKILYHGEGDYGEISEIELREIFKDPITDDGTKRSKKGLLQVGYKLGDTKEIICNDQQTWEQESNGLLTTVFKDGKLVKETSLDEIRNKLNKQ